MKNILGNIEDILNQGLSGYRQFVLETPVRTSYLSQNFLEMVGLSASDIVSENAGLYISLVHPADLKRYTGFIDALREKEQTLSIEYRLLKKNGKTIYVRDTATSRRLGDGTMVCDCVLCDITDIKRENENLRFLSETMSCGFVKYTCEKQPRVTYINKQMMDFLRMPAQGDGDNYYMDMYKDNIYLMIPSNILFDFNLFVFYFD